MEKRSTYPVLVGKLAERGIKKKQAAEALGCTPRALYNKLSGRVDFSWSEVCKIQQAYFPDISKEELFARRDRKGA